MAQFDYGYLNQPNGYLHDSYLAGFVQDFGGMQINQVIEADDLVGMQADQVVEDFLAASGIQLNQIIAEVEAKFGIQVDMIVTAESQLGVQILVIDDAEMRLGFQIEIELSDNVDRGVQVREDTLRHATLGVYLSYPYLSDPYLIDRMAAFCGMQINQMVTETERSGIQVDQVINADRDVGTQVSLVIPAEKHAGFQVALMQADSFGFQITQVIYNATQLRIMYDFPSRGTQALLGDNWTATSTAPGDFEPSNLNSDLTERVWRSGNDPSSQTLTCDTGLSQGVPIDTIAILNSNLTRSATIQVQGSQDNFATTRIVFNMSVETLNSYYISPDFPSALGQNRYWRFIIQDGTNPDGYLSIGTIIFGASKIFSTLEFPVLPVVFGYRHFKDSVPTEGFTNVSNDRALKRFLRLSFQDLDLYKGNFTLLEEMILMARTSLKVLVIPKPEYPSRFAVFGKLALIPEISHNDIDRETDYISADFEWDESL